ncbi:hypothetical protein pb186bvf_005149 [Paramecium bursaria]
MEYDYILKTKLLFLIRVKIYNSIYAKISIINIHKVQKQIIIQYTLKTLLQDENLISIRIKSIQIMKTSQQLKQKWRIVIIYIHYCSRKFLKM